MYLSCYDRTTIELIDTCWNVNTTTPVTAPAILLELIDTCWNVNSSSVRMIL